MKDKKVFAGIFIFVCGVAFVVVLFTSERQTTGLVSQTNGTESSASNAATTTEINGTKRTLVKVDYETSTQTLQRLGFSSLNDIEKLSDGSKAKNMMVQELKKELGILDSSKNDSEILENSFSVAVNLAQLGQTDKAIKQYEYVLERSPNHATTLNNLVSLYVSTKNYSKAEEYLKKSLASAPTLATHYINLADFYRGFMREKNVEILALIQKGIDNSPEKVTLMTYMAEYYHQEKDYTKAIEWYKKALVIEPDSAYIKENITALEVAKAQ